MTREQLETEFHGRGTLRGGILMLRPDDAIAFVRRARDAGIAVLGVDAFQITDRTTQPFMEHSADYTTSSAPPPPDSWTEAEQFLAGFRNTTFVFEVVLDSQAALRDDAI